MTAIKRWVEQRKSDMAVSTDRQRWICGPRAIGLTAAILFLGVATGARASALIDVQFTYIRNPSYSGAAVLGSAGDSWNTFSGFFAYVPAANGLSLTDTTGASTGVTLGYMTSEGGFYNAGSSSIFDGTSYSALLDGFFYTDAGGRGPGSVTLSGLTPGADYQLVLYSVADTPGRVTDFTVDGTTQSVDPTSTTTLTEGVNYTEFTAVADPSGDLTIGFTGPNGGEGDINGLQLQALPPQSTPVPEPASALLLGSGLVPMVAVRRRKMRGWASAVAPRRSRGFGRVGWLRDIHKFGGTGLTPRRPLARCLSDAVP